jgi:GNAT superfamily N-acetyltransferase
MSAELLIRRAVASDLPALGRMGAGLMRTHFSFDPLRFMDPGSDPEAGYAWFLGTQIHEDDVAIFVAELDGAVAGYLYAGLEPQSWKELREAAGFIHDLVVIESARRTGIGGKLMDAGLAWLKSRGAPRAMLWTAHPNQEAQQLFARLGFRRTMVEMTREL